MRRKLEDRINYLEDIVEKKKQDEVEFGEKEK